MVGRVVVVLCVVSFAVGCGAEMSSDAGTGGGTGMTASGGGSGSMTMAPTANCAGFCSKMQTANCGDAPANCTAACEQLVNASAACKNIQSRFFNCIAEADAAQVQCSNRVTTVASCDSIGRLVGATGCAAAVNKSSCYGTPCRFDSDCGALGEWECNAATDRCVRAGTECIGLPCRFDADCGDTAKYACNTALNTCVAN